MQNWAWKQDRNRNSGENGQTCVCTEDCRSFQVSCNDMCIWNRALCFSTIISDILSRILNETVMREVSVCRICFNLLNDIDYHLKVCLIGICQGVSLSVSGGTREDWWGDCKVSWQREEPPEVQPTENSGPQTRPSTVKETEKQSDNHHRRTPTQCGVKDYPDRI